MSSLKIHVPLDKENSNLLYEDRSKLQFLNDVFRPQKPLRKQE